MLGKRICDVSICGFHSKGRKDGQGYIVKSRYYNPETCRILNADLQLNPISGFSGMKLFVYCLNDPVNLFDPDGFAPKSNEQPPASSGYITPKGGVKQQKDKYGHKGWVDKMVIYGFWIRRIMVLVVQVIATIGMYRVKMKKDI